MTCAECEKIKLKKNAVYEDELVIAVLNDKPATGGHLLLLPKQHFTIIEQIPDETVSRMFSIANRLSVACFDTLGAHGTNILIQNGVAAGQKSSHASVHIIPRVENDGLNLQWQPIKATEEDLKASQMALESELEKKDEKKDEVKELPKEEEVIEEIPEEENYLLKQLERIP